MGTVESPEDRPPTDFAEVVVEVRDGNADVTELPADAGTFVFDHDAAEELESLGRSYSPRTIRDPSAAARWRYGASYGSCATWTWWRAGPRGNGRGRWARCARRPKGTRWSGWRGRDRGLRRLAGVGHRRPDRRR